MTAAIVVAIHIRKSSSSMSMEAYTFITSAHCYYGVHGTRMVHIKIGLLTVSMPRASGSMFYSSMLMSTQPAIVEKNKF